MLHQCPEVPWINSDETISLPETIARLESCLERLKQELNRRMRAPGRVPCEEEQVRKILKARRLREQQLGAELFADPAWDMLLELYACELGQQSISVSGLCCASSVPATTALRWISKLEEDGWLLRKPDPFDGRRYWIALTSDGSAKLARYFEAVWPSALPL